MRQNIFNALVATTSRRARWVILAAFVITIVAGGLSGRLRLETQFLSLVPRDEPAALEFDSIIRQYASASQVIVGIEGDDKKQMIAFAHALEKRAKEAMYTERQTGKQAPYVKRIVARSDVAYIEEHGLMLVEKDQLNNLETLYRDLDVLSLVSAYNDFFEREYIEDTSSVTEREKEDRAIVTLKSIVTWLEGILPADKRDAKVDALADKASRGLAMGSPYLFSDDDRMLLVLVTPAISIDRYDESKEGIVSLREIVRDIEGSAKGVTVRMSGMPVGLVEQNEVSAKDTGIASVIALILVLTLFIAAFRMWTAPILAMLNLIVGIIWTAGFIAVTYGRLNLITVVFAVILIGLGIDFAIHLNAAFSTARGEGKSLESCLRAMYQQAGPGVITGALTSATAFYALVFTGLDALGEFGVVLGSGILLTLLSSLTLLPAMFAVHFRTSDRIKRKKETAAKPVLLSFAFLGTVGEGIRRHPRPVFAVMLIVTAVFAVASSRASFQPDMLAIQPPDMPSVTLHREILQKFELFPDYSMVTSTDFDGTRRMVKKVKNNRLIGRVDAITNYLPSPKEQRERAPIVQRIHERMAHILSRQNAPNTNVIPTATPAIAPSVVEAPLPSEKMAPKESTKTTSSPRKANTTALFKELDRLQANVIEIGQLAFTSMKHRLKRTCDRLAGGENEHQSIILGLKKKLQNKAELETNISVWEQAYVPLLATKINQMANTAPLTIAALPEKIKERYMSAKGANLITIYPSVDLMLDGKTELFLKATHKASNRVTGPVILTDRLVTLVGEKGVMAIVLALGAVFLILLLDFRHVGYALLGVVPLMAGFIWMVGIFVLLGRQFDISNATGLPMILGIGIDDAVHVLHGIRRKGSNALSDVLRRTGRALLITSLTTGIAFFTIALSSHRGMAGMGILLMLGVGSCFITSVILLPALLRLFDRS